MITKHELFEEIVFLVIEIFKVRKTVGQEGSLIKKVQIEVPATVSKGGAPFPYPEEWVLWYPGSSNHKNANVDIFKDV